MKAAVIDSLERGPRFADFADPVVGGGEILVEVTAAGLHPIVRMLASGEHYGSVTAAGGSSCGLDRRPIYGRDKPSRDRERRSTLGVPMAISRSPSPAVRTLCRSRIPSTP